MLNMEDGAVMEWFSFEGGREVLISVVHFILCVYLRERERERKISKEGEKIRERDGDRGRDFEEREICQ